MKMIISEHLFRADQNIEVYEFKSGSLVWAYYKDGEYILFRNLDDFVKYIYLGEDIERIYLSEEELDTIFEDEGNFSNFNFEK